MKIQYNSSFKDVKKIFVKDSNGDWAEVRKILQPTTSTTRTLYTKSEESVSHSYTIGSDVSFTNDTAYAYVYEENGNSLTTDEVSRLGLKVQFEDDNGYWEANTSDGLFEVFTTDRTPDNYTLGVSYRVELVDQYDNVISHTSVFYDGVAYVFRVDIGGTMVTLNPYNLNDIECDDEYTVEIPENYSFSVHVTDTYQYTYVEGNETLRRVSSVSESNPAPEAWVGPPQNEITVSFYLGGDKGSETSYDYIDNYRKYIYTGRSFYEGAEYQMCVDWITPSPPISAATTVKFVYDTSMSEDVGGGSASEEEEES